MKAWKERYPNLELPVGGDLHDDLQLMNCLDALLTMDSANMHLGSLANTKVLSIWGATHPFAGFAAWNQPASHQLQLDLFCRPCSIYGKKPCYRKDLACLNGLEPLRIVHFIESALTP
jgi:ADP-heptose:LPS heptosyltransferase